MVDFYPNVGTSQGSTGSVDSKPLTRREAKELNIDYEIRRELIRAGRQAKKLEAKAERLEARGRSEKAAEVRAMAQTANEQAEGLEALVEKKRTAAELKETLAETPATTKYVSTDANNDRIKVVSLKVVDGNYYVVKDGKHQAVTTDAAGEIIAKGELMPPGSTLDDTADSQLHTQLLEGDPYYKRLYQRFESRFNDFVKVIPEHQPTLDKQETEDGRVKTSHMYYVHTDNTNTGEYVAMRDQPEYRNLATMESAMNEYRQIVANWEDGTMPENSKLKQGGSYIEVTERVTLPDGRKAFISADGLTYPLGLGGNLMPAI